MSFSRSTDRLQRRRRRLLYCVLRPVEAASVRTRAKEEEGGAAAAAATVDTVECAQRAEANRTPCASVAPLPISPLSTFICLLLLSFCTRTNCKLRRVVDYSRISRLSSSFGPFSLRRKKNLFPFISFDVRRLEHQISSHLAKVNELKVTAISIITDLRYVITVVHSM